MAKLVRKVRPAKAAKPKVAVGCQGGGVHAAFAVGVLTEILKDIQKKDQFELVGLSGTSAGALCALMAWYGLAPKVKNTGSVQAAIDHLDSFWNGFAARAPAEMLLNSLTYGAYWAEEREIPVLGVNAPVFSLNPFGAISKAIAAGLPLLGVRHQYFDLDKVLAEACPEFDDIDWPNVKTRLLLGASEVINGVETVFDSYCNMEAHGAKHTEPTVTHGWRKRLPLTLRAVTASGTLPTVREAERIHGGYYWDGLYSQNPPVRELIAGPGQDQVPDELWIVRINPQQWPELPKSNADIQDRQNELMGNLSLNKELDFILTVNEWHKRYEHEEFGQNHKHVTVRTIKMKEKTADELRYSSKFNRSRDFIDQLRAEGRAVARDWLADWPNWFAAGPNSKIGCYPDDAGYRKI
jgi:NTE family protein